MHQKSQKRSTAIAVWSFGVILSSCHSWLVVVTALEHCGWFTPHVNKSRAGNELDLINLLLFWSVTPLTDGGTPHRGKERTVTAKALWFPTMHYLTIRGQVQATGIQTNTTKHFKQDPFVSQIYWSFSRYYISAFHSLFTKDYLLFCL